MKKGINTKTTARIQIKIELLIKCYHLFKENQRKLVETIFSEVGSKGWTLKSMNEIGLNLLIEAWLVLFGNVGLGKGKIR